MENFISLTMAQRAVMDALLKADFPADHVKPATLGSLATKGLVNVIDGMIRCQCSFTYSLFKAGYRDIN